MVNQSADVAKQVENVVEGMGKLANGKIEHVLKNHSYGRLRKTIDALMNKGLTQNAENLLNQKSFFKTDWSNDKIIDATTKAYNEALAKGITNGNYTTKVFGEKITVNFNDGVFSSAWGDYKLMLSDFGY